MQYTKFTKSIWCSLLLVTGSAFIAHSSWANPTSQSAIAINCEGALNPEDVAPMDSIFGDVTRGLSNRGYLGNTPEYSTDNMIIGIQQAVMRWGLKFYQVNSVEEAQKHNEFKFNRDMSPEKIAALGSLHYTSPPDMPIYMLVTENPSVFLPLYEKQKDDKNLPHEVFHRLAKTIEVFYFTLDGQRIVLTPDEIASFTSITYLKNNDNDHFFYQPGWFAPKFIGVESIKRFKTSSQDPSKRSSTYVSLIKSLRSAYRQGLRITFNYVKPNGVPALDDLLILAGTQARIGSNNKVDKRTHEQLELGPYNKTNRDIKIALQKQGNAYSVEVWDGDPADPKTKLLGGTFGRVAGGIVTVDSLAYIEMKKVRNFDSKKQPLYMVGPGLLLTYEAAIQKGQELLAVDTEKGKPKESDYYVPQPSYVWENPNSDQTNAKGEVEYLVDDSGVPIEIPRGEFGDFANVALYDYLESIGIDITNVGMVTPKSNSTFKAQYVPLTVARNLFYQQSQRLKGLEITWPPPASIYRPDGFKDEDYAAIVK